MTLAQLIHAQGLTGQNYPAIADALNAPTTVANPVTVAPQVDKPITRESVIALVPDAEAWAIYSAGAKLIDDLFAAIDTGNRVWLAKLLGIVSSSGKLTETTLGKLQTELAAKVVDPTWTATISGPSIAAAAGLGVITPAMVQTADQETGGNGLYGATA